MGFRYALAVIALAMAAAVGCGGDDGPTATVSAPSETATSAPDGEPTESDGPGGLPGSGVGAFEVAFAGLQVERPIELVEVPGQGLLLLALQDGVVLAFEKQGDGSDAWTALDWSGRVSRDGNEEGLLGMVLDPGFEGIEGNGYVYLNYSVAEGERRTRVARFDAVGEGPQFRIDPGSELVILEVAQPFGNHKGGKIAFGPDGMLYIALGDGGSGGDPMGNGQDLQRNLLGGILRIDVSEATPNQPYEVPADNPWADGAGGARPEYWAYGLRNPWRFSFDRETGALWAGDVGQGEVEEIDIIVGGGNYGWNIMEGTRCFESSDCDQAGLSLPVAEYSHDFGCSVTGGVVYRGEAVESMYGWYVYGDYCSGVLWALEAGAAAGGARVEPRVLSEDGPAPAAFAEDLDGEVYLLSFDGRVYRLVGVEAGD
ncbi:MAG: PQQ-dependent sugar dehydrogenase [Dehalococcoidia bacterium]